MKRSIPALANDLEITKSILVALALIRTVVPLALDVAFESKTLAYVLLQ